VAAETPCNNDGVDARVAHLNSLTDAGISSRQPAVRAMLRTNLALGTAVFVAWLLLGGERAIEAMIANWQVSVTMVFGSLVGGGTSEGGGAVAFPVLTKVLGVPAAEARLFAFAIQTVGMGCATISIVRNRVPLEWRAIRYGAPPAMLAVFLSCLLIAPLLEATTVRLLFTSILVGLAIALWTSRRFSPGRRSHIEPFGWREVVAIVAAGVLGGLLSGLAAVGENTIMFVLLVLALRVSERVVTPTTVVLMTIVSVTGFATHALVMGDFHGQGVDMWLAAVPVVAFGAPTGALLATRMSRNAIVRILYSLIALELVTTLLIVPMSGGQGIAFATAILAFTLVCVRMATWRHYEVRPPVASPAA
jgi:uncharacterized membrane protein YfcA